MFELPDSKKSIAQNQFQFRVGETEYSIPKIRYLTVDQADKINAAESEADVMLLAGDLVGTPALKKELRAMPAEHLIALLQAWGEDSGITAGESSGSSSSAESIDEPSSLNSPDTDTGSMTSE